MDKYRGLAKQLKKLWNIKVGVILIIVGPFRKELQNMEETQWEL